MLGLTSMTSEPSLYQTRGRGTFENIGRCGRELSL